MGLGGWPHPQTARAGTALAGLVTEACSPDQQNADSPSRSTGAESRAKVLPEAREGRQPGCGAAATAEEARRAPVSDAGDWQPPGARRARQPPGAPRHRLLWRGQRVRGLADVQWRPVAAHAGHDACSGAESRRH